jgi:hypothetical protein
MHFQYKEEFVFYQFSMNRELGPAGFMTLVALLILSLATFGYGNGWVGSSQPMSDTETAMRTGGMDSGSCGILLGIGVGILALGVAGISVGIGSAFLLSVGAHVAAGMCVN